MTKNIIIILLIILIVYNNDKCNEFFTVIKTKSKDGKSYKVLTKYSDQDKAADIISEINIFTEKLIKTLKHEYIDSKLEKDSNLEKNLTNKKLYIKGKELTQALINKYNSESLQENEPETPDKVSYTKNKGEVIALCLREKNTNSNNFHKLDVLKFVLIHELAHIITPELNHSMLFWVNFKFLLDFCEKHNLYIAPDYKNNPFNYCGMNIVYNPSLDEKIVSYFG